MKPAETTKNVSYSGTRRVVTLERVITRAEDASRLGELYFRLSDIYRRLEEKIPAEEREQLLSDAAELTKEIAEYRSYLDGYAE